MNYKPRSAEAVGGPNVSKSMMSSISARSRAIIEEQNREIERLRAEKERLMAENEKIRKRKGKLHELRKPKAYDLQSSQNKKGPRDNFLAGIQNVPNNLSPGPRLFEGEGEVTGVRGVVSDVTSHMPQRAMHQSVPIIVNNSMPGVCGGVSDMTSRMSQQAIHQSVPTMGSNFMPGVLGVGSAGTSQMSRQAMHHTVLYVHNYTGAPVTGVNMPGAVGPGFSIQVQQQIQGPQQVYGSEIPGPQIYAPQIQPVRLLQPGGMSGPVTQRVVYAHGLIYEEEGGVLPGQFCVGTGADKSLSQSQAQCRRPPVKCRRLRDGAVFSVLEPPPRQLRRRLPGLVGGGSRAEVETAGLLLGRPPDAVSEPRFQIRSGGSRAEVETAGLLLGRPPDGISDAVSEPKQETVIDESLSMRQETFVDLRMECQEEPLSTAQLQMMAAAKEKYDRAKRLIETASQVIWKVQEGNKLPQLLNERWMTGKKPRIDH